MAIQVGRNLKIETGTFTPSVGLQTITVNHSLGAVPKIFYCNVSDSGISQDSSFRISFYGTMLGEEEKQLQMRSRNGQKYYSGVVFSIGENATAPTSTQITFGGSNGTGTNWLNTEYTWTAMTWDD